MITKILNVQNNNNIELFIAYNKFEIHEELKLQEGIYDINGQLMEKQKYNLKLYLSGEISINNEILNNTNNIFNINLMERFVYICKKQNDFLYTANPSNDFNINSVEIFNDNEICAKNQYEIKKQDNNIYEISFKNNIDNDKNIIKNDDFLSKEIIFTYKPIIKMQLIKISNYKKNMQIKNDICIEFSEV